MPRRLLKVLMLFALTALPAAADPPEGNVERGKRIFEESTCDSCHGKDGNGPDLSSEGNLHRSNEWLAVQITAPEKHNPKTIMPPQKLSPEELSVLVAWLQAQRAPLVARAAEMDGHALFLARCRTCHFLPVPETYSFTAEQWPVVVNFMYEGKKASRFITPQEREQISAYLVSVARKKEAKNDH